MLGVVLAVAAALAASTSPPAPSRWVEDHAGLLSPATRSALDARLEAYEHATGHQVVVWIDKTLGGAPLDDWAVRTFAAWKIGRAGFDDGIAVFVFADDRRIDIEVGYGLEAKLPDATASRIIREVMAPRLRAGQADTALTAGADAILAAIEGHAWQATGSTGTSDGTSIATWIVGGVVALAMLILFVTHPRLFLLALWMLARSSGASGGRGGGGRGFGGGGGRSGGGGARGGW
jgi:uncharacterized protein